MKKIILTLVFVMGIMGLSAVARADTPDWMNPDSPLALGLHPRLLFISHEYREAHPDAVGMTVSEMRAKLISHHDYITEFQEFVDVMDKVFNEDIVSKLKCNATWDAVNFSFLYIIDPSIMSSPPYNFRFGHTREEYGNKAVDHAVYIAIKAMDIKEYKDWVDHYVYPSDLKWKITNISLAIVNDWVNDKISKEQRQLIIDGIWNLYNAREDIIPLGSGSYGQAQNGDAGILGIYGDDIDIGGETTYQSYMSSILDSLNTDWLRGFKELSNKFYGEGSNNPQGPTYNMNAIYRIIPFITILSTALNENYYSTITYLRDWPLSELFYTKPRPIDGIYYRFRRDDTDTGATGIDFEYGWYRIISNSIINMLSEDRPGNASLMKWLVDDSGLFKKKDTKNPRYFSVFYNFFMGNKDVVSKSPEELNLPLSKDVGMGEYVMRTGFTDPDASMVVFFAPKYHISDSGHGHREFAAFSISKCGDLAIRHTIAKGFSGGNFRSTKVNMFYNTIGVCKPGAIEEEQGIIDLNVMGYRSGYDENAIDPDDPAYNENGRNHVGTVLVDDLEGKNYDYIDYDYTNSWSGLHDRKYTQKVDYAEREFVYLRSAGGINDEYVVVFDRINSLDPNYAKYWLLHASYEPRLLDNAGAEIDMTAEGYPNDADGIGGGRWVNKTSTPTQNNTIEITNKWREDNSHGCLYNKTLLPESFQINKVGGPGHYWEDAEGKLIYPGFTPGDNYSTKYAKVFGFGDLPQEEKDFYNKYYNGNPGPDGKYYYLPDDEKNHRGAYTMQVQSTTGRNRSVNGGNKDNKFFK